MNASQFLELPLPGKVEIINLEFKLTSFDVQDCGGSLLISVSGSAVTDQRHLFTQVLMVTFGSNNQLIVMADIFRFV